MHFRFCSTRASPLTLDIRFRLADLPHRILDSAVTCQFIIAEVVRGQGRVFQREMSKRIPATFLNISRSREETVAEYHALRQRLEDQINDRVAALQQVAAADSHQVLTPLERDVHEFCRLSEKALSVESLYSQIKQRGPGTRLKLTYEQLALWDKANDQQEADDGAERGLETDGEVVGLGMDSVGMMGQEEEEEYRALI